MQGMRYMQGTDFFGVLVSLFLLLIFWGYFFHYFWYFFHNFWYFWQKNLVPLSLFLVQQLIMTCSKMSQLPMDWYAGKNLCHQNLLTPRQGQGQKSGLCESPLPLKKGSRGRCTHYPVLQQVWVKLFATFYFHV